MARMPEYQLNLAEERLWRNGQLVGVKKKVFDLLRVFVENPDQLVTKTVILERVARHPCFGRVGQGLREKSVQPARGRS